MPRALKWIKNPRPGELTWHIKWVHSVWVADGLRDDEYEYVHASLHAGIDGMNKGIHACHNHPIVTQDVLSSPDGDGAGFW